MEQLRNDHGLLEEHRVLREVPKVEHRPEDHSRMRTSPPMEVALVEECLVLLDRLLRKILLKVD